jgi:hypothetical protein
VTVCAICTRRLYKSKDSFQEHWSHVARKGFVVHNECARLHPAIIRQLLREIDEQR